MISYKLPRGIAPNL